MKLSPLNAVGTGIYNGVSAVKNATVSTGIAVKNFMYDCTIDQHKRAASKIGAKQFVKNPTANKVIQVIFKIAASVGIFVGSTLTAGIAPAIKVYFDRKAARVAAQQLANQQANEAKKAKRTENLSKVGATIAVFATGLCALTVALSQIANTTSVYQAANGGNSTLPFTTPNPFGFQHGTLV